MIGFITTRGSKTYCCRFATASCWPTNSSQRKSEIRISKSETNYEANQFQPNAAHGSFWKFSPLGHLNLFRISDFELRIWFDLRAWRVKFLDSFCQIL